MGLKEGRRISRKREEVNSVESINVILAGFIVGLFFFVFILFIFPIPFLIFEELNNSEEIKFFSMGIIALFIGSYGIGVWASYVTIYGAKERGLIYTKYREWLRGRVHCNNCFNFKTSLKNLPKNCPNCGSILGLQNKKFV